MVTRFVNVLYIITVIWFGMVRESPAGVVSILTNIVEFDLGNANCITNLHKNC